MQATSFRENQKRFSQQGAGFSVGLRRDYGDMVYADVPLLPRIYFLFHPDHAHDILVTHASQVEKPRLINMVLRSSFGNGLFTSDGAFWRRQRKLMQPVFHHAHVGKFAERIVAHTQAMLASWRDGEQRVIDAEMHALTLTIVVDALFSTDIAADTAEIGEAMHNLGAAIGAQGASLPLAFMPDWVPLPIMRRKRRGVQTINHIIYRMIQERRRIGEEISPHDLLSSLVFTQDADTGERMDDGQVRDELMTLFIAGHDTTAALMGWIWTLLAKNPEAEAKLTAELAATLAGRPPALSDLPGLPYTQQIVKETLRLYPSAWFIMRQAKEALTVGGETVRKNGLIFLFPFANHRDERWFAEPERFLPERWVEDFEKTLPKGAYLPFGKGPRVCIGNGFATMEAQLLLATIAQQYHVELRSEARPVKATGTLGFEQPVQVRLHRRG